MPTAQLEVHLPPIGEVEFTPGEFAAESEATSRTSRRVIAVSREAYREKRLRRCVTVGSRSWFLRATVSPCDAAAAQLPPTPLTEAEGKGG